MLIVGTQLCNYMIPGILLLFSYQCSLCMFPLIKYKSVIPIIINSPPLRLNIIKLIQPFIHSDPNTFSLHLIIKHYSNSLLSLHLSIHCIIHQSFSLLSHEHNNLMFGNRRICIRTK